MEEEKEKADIFIAELKKLCKKYEITNASFVGEMKNNFLGIMGIDVEQYGNLGNFFLSAINLGRLYQSAKEKIKNIFNDYEK